MMLLIVAVIFSIIGRGQDKSSNNHGLSIPRRIAIFEDSVFDFRDMQGHSDLDNGTLITIYESWGCLVQSCSRVKSVNSGISQFYYCNPMLPQQWGEYKTGYEVINEGKDTLQYPVKNGTWYYWNELGQLVKKEFWKEGKLSKGREQKKPIRNQDGCTKKFLYISSDTAMWEAAKKDPFYFESLSVKLSSNNRPGWEHIDSLRTKPVDYAYGYEIVLNNDASIILRITQRASSKNAGLYFLFYSNGMPHIKGNYKNGNKEGRWYYWDESGRLIRKEKWKNGKLMKPM